MISPGSDAGQRYKRAAGYKAGAIAHGRTADAANAQRQMDRALADMISENKKIEVTKMKGFTIKNGLLEKYNGSDCNIVVPDTVTRIGDMAFAGCAEITQIILPEGVNTIGLLAFSDCQKLTAINIPDSVTEIGPLAFRRCKSLKEVTLSKNVVKLASDAFAGCTKLSVYAPVGSLAQQSIAEGIVRQWQKLRKDIEALMEDWKPHDRSDKTKRRQTRITNEFTKAAIETYDILMTMQGNESFPKYIAKLLCEIGAYAWNTRIKEYADGYMNVYTCMAAGLCNIVTENHNYSHLDSRKIVIYIGEKNAFWDKGYYLANLENRTLAYIGSDDPFRRGAKVNWRTLNKMVDTPKR